ncbi:thioredoxin domain-containing protein [Candidatus Uhrbacteria bacterium]|nr:thioredoxin domain-containing protein [Candidatus Uhrbacteria bacterium]
MQHRWLSLLSITFLGLIVFIFFWYRIQPIEIPQITQDIEVGSLTEPTITFVNPSKGASNPTITIVEFGDFECTACNTLATALTVALKTFPQDLRVVWKDLPNESAHPLATPAAMAAHCADQQGAFWAYHDILFSRQAYLTESQLPQIAEEIGLDVKKFTSCFDSQETLPIIKKDYQEGLALGITSTPTFFIEDKMYVGAIETNDLLELIKATLSQ